MELNLKEKNVLVTGGTRGIGKAIAHAFLQEGASVGITARNQEELTKAQNELGVQTYRKDLTIPEQREELMEAFIKNFSSIDVLVNNAGASYGQDVLQTPISSFEQAMETNYISAVHLSQLAGTMMKRQQDGVIINIASIFGKEAGGAPAYNASKAALISHTKSLSSELIKDHIRVVGIAPGATYHPNQIWQNRLKEDPKYLKKYAENKIPAGRLGTTDEIANVAVFLASEKASWIVGTTITVDGGQSRLNF
ncbi:3-oxoacyl-[acyl-carrier protein] reductase [Salinibacillus kushneri]|uniref:3-oxoacyl-[acyl-carrier protein] reductase n=1 Tax=Salinibacillus kushneri TaxID=237682 RepID=A0A1I0AGS9_9BACI|nr:SDR family oxidoreductase [Salinibacillus kushneri]SES93398.1 3-oxoacyl-[acyl-carrier protein] reductase [Salinibacillus kushneri]